MDVSAAEPVEVASFEAPAPAQTTGLAFDANGNQTSYGTGSFTYNARNQTAQLTSPTGATATVTYGDAGQAERTKLGASFLRSDIRAVVGRGANAGGTGGAGGDLRPRRQRHPGGRQGRGDHALLPL